MKEKSKKLLTLGVVSLLVAIAGCQTSTPIKPRTTAHAAPQPLVDSYGGSFRLDPAVNMAVTLKLSDFAPKKYQLQVALPPSSDPNQIETIRITVSGGGLSDPLVREVSRSEFVDGEATVTFASLASGTYDVKGEALNASGDVISQATSQATITPGARVRIDLDCQPTSGSLTVGFHCSDEPCNGGGATPTPTPTATPVPPPADTRPYMGQATGFSVDRQGNVYVYGQDLTPVSGNPFPGRIVKVPANLQLDSNAIFDDNITEVCEGEIKPDPTDPQNDMLYNAERHVVTGSYGQWYEILEKYHLGSGTIDTTPIGVGGAFFEGWMGVTVDNTGAIYYSTGGVDNGNHGTYSLFQEPTTTKLTRSADEGARPVSLSWATDRPVWSAEQGIWTLSGGAPQQLLAAPAYGMELIMDDASQLLYTTYTDAKVYYWNANQPTDNVTNPLPAYTFNRGVAYRVEKQGNNFYVMLTEGGSCCNTFRYANLGGSKNYRIIKMTFDFATHQLVPVQTLVDTFVDPTPSY